MNERDFCYWLQGFFELTVPTSLTEWQVKAIKEHLDRVFNKSVEPNTNLHRFDCGYPNLFSVVMPENMPTC